MQDLYHQQHDGVPQFKVLAPFWASDFIFRLRPSAASGLGPAEAPKLFELKGSTPAGSK